MNKIKPTQLYNIITTNDFGKLEQFFNENPDFDIHHKLSIGKKYAMLEQAVASLSNDCALLLMNRMESNLLELINKYANFIISNGNIIIFNYFDLLFNRYLDENGNLEVIKIIISRILQNPKIVNIEKTQEYIKISANYINGSNDFDFVIHILKLLIYSYKSSSMVLTKYFINLINDYLINKIKTNKDFMNNLENLIIGCKYDFVIMLIEFYNKNNFNLDEFYAKIITCNETIIKKTANCFKDINLSNKVYLNKIRYTYNFDEKNFWRSKKQYSLAFLLVINNLYNEKKHSKLDVFKNNNFETELLNLLDETQSQIDDNSRNNFLFFGVLKTLQSVNLDFECIKHWSQQPLYYFFGENNDDVITPKIKELKSYFTDNIYNKLLEINELAFANINNYVEYINKSEYKFIANVNNNEYINKMQPIYQSNKEAIQRMRNVN